jgi:nicotinamide-nucleotide amidase
MEKVFATIVTIGDELLIGQVIDTNSAWIAQELNKAGVLLRKRISVGDDRDEIWKALDDASKESSLVLITGGLGPTADDITKPVLCEYFGGKMVVHEPTLQHITYLFEQVLKRPMIERNRKQAEVPDVCEVLFNGTGTAPGMLFEKNGVFFVSMPGVPHEMKWLMNEHVLPMIPQKLPVGIIRHRTLLTARLGESFLAEMIKEVEDALPAHIKLAYLPNYGMVRLRLTGFGQDEAILNQELDHHFGQLAAATGKYLVVKEDLSMEKIVTRLLQERNQTLSTAESCTGGYIAHLISKHPGASSIYKGSIVSYANEVKEQVLQVPHSVIETAGAVSRETVLAMANTAKELMNTTYTVAVSGIMGPDGGTETKPVGLVWIAVAGPNKTIAKSFQLRYDRGRNIDMTAVYALDLVRRMILNGLDDSAH